MLEGQSEGMRESGRGDSQVKIIQALEFEPSSGMQLPDTVFY